MRFWLTPLVTVHRQRSSVNAPRPHHNHHNHHRELKYDMGISFLVAYFVRLVSCLEDLVDFCLANLVLIFLGYFTDGYFARFLNDSDTQQPGPVEIDDEHLRSEFTPRCKCRRERSKKQT